MQFVGKVPLEIHRGDRIFIRANNWIGDVVLATPALSCIRHSFPDARISILAKPWVIPVMAYNPHIDEIITYDGKGIHKGLTGIWRVSQNLKAQGFQIAILLQRAFEAAVIAYLARIPIRMGYSTDSRGLLLTHRVKASREEFLIHRVEHNLKLLEGFGLTIINKDLILRIGEKPLKQAEQLLLSLGISKEDRLFGLSPGTALSTLKRWYPDRFAQVAARIARTHNAKGIILGAPDDKALGEQVLHLASDSRIYNLIGTTTLEDAISLIVQCGLFISNDSGLMHIAAALDVPLVAIFGPSDFRTTAPWCKRHILVRKETVQCSPCMKKENCPHDHQCMRDISVEDVFNSAETLVGTYGFETTENREKNLAVAEKSVPVV